VCAGECGLTDRLPCPGGQQRVRLGKSARRSGRTAACHMSQGGALNLSLQLPKAKILVCTLPCLLCHSGAGRASSEGAHGAFWAAASEWADDPRGGLGPSACACGPRLEDGWLTGARGSCFRLSN
jgi:hypothetical protein